MDTTDKNFNEVVLNSEIPVLIEFWASWCVPCKMVEYILNELEVIYDGRIKILKLNVDRNRITPKKYKVTGVPTFMIFKNGEVIITKMGALSKTQLIKIIEKSLK
ncbi:MAG: thioredoxin [Promethearchaeota archaeon]